MIQSCIRARILAAHSLRWNDVMVAVGEATLSYDAPSTRRSRLRPAYPSPRWQFHSILGTLHANDPDQHPTEQVDWNAGGK